MLAHCEMQTDEEAVVEGETTFEDLSQTLMEIPNDLVLKVREHHAKHVD